MKTEAYKCCFEESLKIYTSVYLIIILLIQHRTIKFKLRYVQMLLFCSVEDLTNEENLGRQKM